MTDVTTVITELGTLNETLGTIRTSLEGIKNLIADLKAEDPVTQEQLDQIGALVDAALESADSIKAAEDDITSPKEEEV